MIDLERLGQELRGRRRALRIPSAELARRIGVSPTYVWLIEQAKPRPRGEPSRPSEELLGRWTVALGMDDTEARHIRELAGYFGPARPVSVPSQAQQFAPASATSVPRDDRLLDTDPSSPPQVGMARSQVSRLFEPQMEALRRWSGAERNEDPERLLVDRMRDVLHQAQRVGRGDEAVSLLDSFLRWLAVHIEDEL